MKIPTKFEVNTEDFKVSFDNQKKTHICESLDTGEKTNVGVLGILMQMGILKPVEDGVEEKIKTLSERLNDLETKINGIIKKVNSVSTEIEEREEGPEEAVVEEVEPKSEINKRIMKNVLKTNRPKIESEPEDELDEGEVEIEDIEAKSDVAEESEEEINNWMDV